MLRDVGRDGKLFGVACPCCGATGDFAGHGSYTRALVVVGREETLSVRRVRCLGCGATHAVLPAGVVPYRAHSEGFVLAVLAAWASGASNADVRGRFGISETTRRRILSSSRRRACALLSCGATRAAVDAALAACGVGAAPALHAASFGTRFAENVRLRPRPVGPRRCRGPST